MVVVKYRSFHPALQPRRTRLTVPGWAGEPVPRQDGSHEYPWHCLPFSEAAVAGIELPYPFPDELRAVTRDGETQFEGEFGADAARRPPFRRFGREYYTFQLLLDLKVPPEYALKAETHPRFYTDTSGTVPIAVPAVLRHWWPMIFFVVFKSPPEGQTHVFRPDEPFMQLSLVPAELKPDLVPMPEDEAAERELMSERIYASRATLGAETRWMSDTRTVFDGTYRRLFAAARKARGETSGE